MVDSAYDFLTPELLNVIFFHQKSVVVFPYVDKKHLKSLEIFCVGYSIIDLDCTVLDDVVGIVGHEVGTYSPNPNFYFIYNASKDIIASLHDMENVHFIINTHEDVSQLVNGHSLIFYNKKNKRFINWKFDSHELGFENHLFEQSQGNISLLHDSLMHIKSFATRIYAALVETNNYPSIPIMFNEQAETYSSEYWERILEFMEHYYDIRTPPEIYKGLQELKVLGKKGSKTVPRAKKPHSKDFSIEYDLIISTDRAISNAFVRALHDYRSEHVNSANLELSQLYNPKELYNYLRNHHWKDNIDEEFVIKWFKDPALINENNSKSVKVMLKKLAIPHDLVIKHEPEEMDENITFDSKLSENNIHNEVEICSNRNSEKKPSIKDFKLFKAWILAKLDQIESDDH